jgi:hypothetical protein
VVLQSFPLLLQLALFLFFTGLSLYLWTVHHTIAIIAMALTCCGFAVYIFLLASAIISPDSPFRNPLSPLVLQTIQITRANQILRIYRQFLGWVWTIVSPLFKRGGDALPCFASNITPQIGLSQLGSKSGNLTYSGAYFAPPSSEVPAVLWVLETSTDPRMIAVAAEMAVGLQWPLGLDLEPPITHLLEAFKLCFGDGPGLWKCQPGMVYRAIQCGRAYCSLRVVAGDRCPYSLRGFISPGENHDPQFQQLAHVFYIAQESSIHQDLVDPSEDSVTLQWTLHVTASRRQDTARTSEIEAQITHFLDQFQVDKMCSLNPSNFASYLCCVNSFMAPVDVRVLAQLDKRSIISQNHTFRDA